jgi:hypothetical protein
MTYVVETYPSVHAWASPERTTHATLAEALSNVKMRLGVRQLRSRQLPPMWSGQVARFSRVAKSATSGGVAVYFGKGG